MAKPRADDEPLPTARQAPKPMVGLDAAAVGALLRNTCDFLETPRSSVYTEAWQEQQLVAMRLLEGWVAAVEAGQAIAR